MTHLVYREFFIYLFRSSSFFFIRLCLRNPLRSERVSWIKKISSRSRSRSNDYVDEDDGCTMGLHVGKWSLSQLRG